MRAQRGREKNKSLETTTLNDSVPGKRRRRAEGLLQKQHAQCDVWERDHSAEEAVGGRLSAPLNHSQMENSIWEDATKMTLTVQENKSECFCSQTGKSHSNTQEQFSS